MSDFTSEVKNVSELCVLVHLELTNLLSVDWLRLRLCPPVDKPI